MAIKIEFDADGFRQQATQYAEMPRGCRRALRQMSGEVVNRLKQVLKDNIGSPTPYTLNAPYTSLLPNAKPAIEIGMKPMQSDYLHYLFEGGTPDRKLVSTDNTPLYATGMTFATNISTTEVAKWSEMSTGRYT